MGIILSSPKIHKSEFRRKSSFFKILIIRLSFAICVISAFPGQVRAQIENKWYQFRDKNTDLVGYKDKRGRVKISAKFGGLTSASIFNHIIAVNEQSTESSYYLLKNGKRIGTDSLYSWDNAYDNENENKIRFRDRVTDKVGFFDKDGKVVIPASYNDALPFRNGFALVVYNGKRLCLDKSTYNPTNPCEHWFWSGVSAIINTQNKIVVDNINIDETDNIDWFKLKITSSPDTTIYRSFKAEGGKFYSFLDFKKEFINWFFKKYLPTLSYKTLSINCYRNISVEDNFKKNRTKFFQKQAFLKKYKNFILNTMKGIQTYKVEAEIFKDDLNPYDYTEQRFEEFYTKDGELDYQKFPCFNVVANYLTKDNKFDYQNQFLFVRTLNGYKLVELAKKI